MNNGPNKKKDNIFLLNILNKTINDLKNRKQYNNYYILRVSGDNKIKLTNIFTTELS